MSAPCCAAEGEPRLYQSDPEEAISKVLFQRFGHLRAASHIPSMDVDIDFLIEPVDTGRLHELLGKARNCGIERELRRLDNMGNKGARVLIPNRNADGRARDPRLLQCFIGHLGMAGECRA